MLQETDCDGQNATSSAYSSLTNSSGELSSNDGHCDMKLPSTDFKMTNSSNSKMSQEIRSIIDDYGATLNKATLEIKALTRSKASIEKAYEELMAVNENLIQDLMLEIQHKKKVEEERDHVIKANDELFNETQRLSDKEAQWAEEKAALETELENATQDLDNLKNDLCDVEALETEAAERNAKMISVLKSEKANLTANVTQLEIENKRLLKELEMAEEERDAILSRKEMVSGENMQLIVEAEHFRVAKGDLLSQLRGLQDKCKELERENSVLRSAPPPPSPVSEVSSEKFATLVERNKLLSEWREQLIEKNQVLTDENKKLKEKCSNLEELLSEEETDISDVLELIRTMQTGAKNGANLGPISPISAVAAKLRGNYK